MVKITSTEFQRNVGTYTDIAMREPVVVTSHQRDRFVVLSAEEYERLVHASEAPLKEFEALARLRIEEHKETLIDLSQR